MKPQRRSSSLPASLPGWAALAALAAALAPGTAAAQAANPAASSPAATQATQADAAEAAKGDRSLWVEPRVEVQETITSNARRDAAGKGDQLTRVSPGLRVVANRPRIKGFFDYSLRSTYYARNTGSDHIDHALDTKATVEAVEQRAFIDVSGVVKTQPISVFGAPVDGTPANPNASQTSRFRLSPYLRGRLGGETEYEARYSAEDSRTDTGKRSNVTQQDWLLHLGSPAQVQGRLLGWTVDANSREADFSPGRAIRTDTLRGSLHYAATPQLTLTAIGGRESTNQLSPTRESHGLAGLGAAWRPSPFTHVVFNREHRYFGSSHNLLLEHRSARIVWRYTDVQGISNALSAQSASLGSLFDLLDGRYHALQPDPVLRAQFVQAELQRLGLPADLPVFQDFLRSSSVLQRQQQLSMALLGRRDTLTLAVSRSDNRRLDGALRLGDDFDTYSRIRQEGWSLLYAHRLTPLTAASASLSEHRSTGLGATAVETRVRSLSLGLNSQLSERTSGGLQLRRTLSRGSASPFDESALIGTITHRF